LPALLTHAAELDSDNIGFDTDFAGCGHTIDFAYFDIDIGFGVAQNSNFMLKTEFRHLVIIQSGVFAAALVDIEVGYSSRLHHYFDHQKLLPWAYTDITHHLHVASMKKNYGHHEDGSLLSQKIHLFYDTAFFIFSNKLNLTKKYG
jgi:hypothetical protein